MHLERVQGAMRALPICRIQTEHVHHTVDGVARHQAIVGVAQVSVVVDPGRFDRGAIDGKFRHWGGARHRGAAQRSSSFSRACAGVSTRAPMASMMVRAFSTSWALLAYTPLLKYRLSSSPTRTLPPSSTACATQG